jgi:hypothetical protein
LGKRHFRIRGFPPVVVTPATSGKLSDAASQRVTRGVTFQWQEFRPRDLEPKSGLKSLKRVLEIEDMKKFSQKKMAPKQ